MKKTYMQAQAEVLTLNEEDILTASAEFQDPANGDNGTYFPDNE